MTKKRSIVYFKSEVCPSCPGFSKVQVKKTKMQIANGVVHAGRCLWSLNESPLLIDRVKGMVVYCKIRTQKERK